MSSHLKMQTLQLAKKRLKPRIAKARLQMLWAVLLSFMTAPAVLAQSEEKPEELRVVSYGEGGDTGTNSNVRNYEWKLTYGRGTNCTANYVLTYEDAWRNQYGHKKLAELTEWLWDTNANVLLPGTKWTTNEIITRYVTNCSEIVTNWGSSNVTVSYNIPLPTLPSATYPQGTLNRTFYASPNAPSEMPIMTFTTALEFYAGHWTNDIPAALFQFPVSAVDGDTLLQIPDGEITFMGKSPDEDDHDVWKAIDNDANESATPAIPARPNHTYNLLGVKEQVTIQANFGTSDMSPKDTMNVAWQGSGIAPFWYDQFVLWAGTSLGMNLTRNSPVDGGLQWGFHKAQFTGTIPAKAKGTITWHRDAYARRWIWSPGANPPTPIEANRNLTFDDHAPNSNDDSGDPVPDSAGNIFDVDAPMVTFNLAAAAESLASPDRPIGSRVALRFFGRQFVKFDNKQVSLILRWRSFVTVKKEANGISFPDDNLLGETPPGASETPSYVVDPATGIPR